MAGKIRKTAGVLFLIVAVLFSQLPGGKTSAKSADFQTNGNVLVKYTGTDKEVTIPDYITVIGEEAFFENTTLECIEIPESVEEIRHHAFYGCSNLKEAAIPDSVERIGNAAFAECDLLEKMSIGNGITEMGNGVFSGCPLLADIELDEDHPTLCCEDGALMSADRTRLYEVLNGSSILAYDMPDTIESIAKYAFWGCDNLQYVSLSDALTEIPAYAFSNCRGLQAVTIPYSVTQIDAKAFENCSHLEAIEIPETVKSIHDTAFDGCTNLQIKASAGSVADRFAKEHVVTAISQAEYEEIRDAVLAQAEEAVRKREEAKQAEETETESEESAGQEAAAEDDNTQDENTADAELYVNPLEVTQADVMGQTVIVSGQAVVFIDNTQQPVYSGEPVSVTVAAQNATDNATTDPEGAVGMDSSVLSDTDSSVSSKNSENADNVEKDQMTGGDSDQKGLSIPKYTVVDGQMIADQAYYHQTTLDSYEFADGIMQIGNFAFARSGLNQVTIPEGVTTIGYGAFYHCDQLVQVDIPDTVTQIAPYAFSETPWLNSWENETGEDFLIVGDGILLAYRGSDSKIYIPDGVKKIAAGCFAGHTGIVAVNIPESVEEIGEEAFYGCTNLYSVSGGTGLVKIADRAFAGCPLAMIPIQGNVSQIGARAFDLGNTVRENGTNIVWFRGDADTVLPQAVYEESATRYYRADTRDLCFCDVSIAVIPSVDTAIEGTVLDPYVSGFRGYICTWDETAPEGEESLIVLKCTLPVTDTQQIEWPEQVQMYGVTYPVTSVSEDALSYYENTDWMESGNSEEEKLTLSLRSTFLNHPELSEVQLSGNQEPIWVTIADDQTAEQQIRECYEALYGENDHVQFHGLTITADTASGIPITVFGTNELNLTVALPDELQSSTVYVLCLDANGQLEVVKSEQLTQDNISCLRFYANHLSPYALMWYKGGAEGASGSGQLDDSPDTGDFFEPKWILCIGMVAVSVVLLLWKTPNKKRHAT